MLSKVFFNRPIGVWLIFLFASYGTLGTGKNVIAVFTNTSAIDTSSINMGPYIVWGIVFILLGFWLMAELWTNGTRQKMAVLANLAATSLMYLSMVLASVATGNNSTITATFVLGAFVVSIWYAAYYYLKKIGR